MAIQETKMYLVPIAQSISRILKTPLGSRVYRPEFGSLLYTLMDRDFDDNFRVKATKYTFEAIKKNEPRITVQRVDFEISPVVGSLILRITLDKGEVEVQLK